MTFYEILKRIARHVADARISVSTGGSTTTLIDTFLDAPNDYYNKGTIFLDQTTPVIRKITDWDSATFTFTFPTISTAIVAGINYTVVNERYPLDVLKMAVNQALTEDIGLIMSVDETVIAVTGQERYALPANVYDIRRIEIGTEDGNWKINYTWKEELGELRFLDDKPQTGDTIRIHYAHSHEELIDLDDVLDPQISIDLIVHAACVYALHWRQTQVRENEPHLKDKLTFHESRVMFARARTGVNIINRDPIHSRF